VEPERYLDPIPMLDQMDGRVEVDHAVGQMFFVVVITMGFTVGISDAIPDRDWVALDAGTDTAGPQSNEAASQQIPLER
jgi:hypothetical protein